MIEFILILLLNTLIVHLTISSIITKVILSGLLLCYNILIYKYIITYVRLFMTFTDIRIKLPAENLIIIFLYFLCYVIGFTYLRIGYLGNALDLNVVISFVKNFMLVNNIYIIIVNIIFYLNLYLCLFLTLRLAGNIIYKHFLQLHFYIISKSPMNLEETIYDRIREYFFLKVYLKITLIPVKLFRKIKTILYGNKDASPTAYDHFIMNLTKYYALILLIIIILYDIIFNDFILNKYYYLLPFVFLYHLMITLEDFFSFTKTEEYDIACYFYHQKLLENEFEIHYNNGHILDKELFKEHIKKHFPKTTVITF